MAHGRISLAAGLLMLMAPLSGAMAGQARTLVIALDISDSSPVAVNGRIAASAAKTVQAQIAMLAPGDRVKLRTLGTAGITAQQIMMNATLGRKARQRPRRVAYQIADVVRALPRLVKRGAVQIQTRTNIIGFLTALSPSLDCKNRATTIVILSDGIEWSSQVRGDDLLTGKKTLPEPTGEILKNCRVEMRGLGQQTNSLGTDSRWFPMLRSAWANYFQLAGVKQFTAYAEFE